MAEILYDADGQAVGRVLCWEGGLVSEAEWDDEAEDRNRWPAVDDYGDEAPAEAEPTGPSEADELWWAEVSNAASFADREMAAA